MHESSQVNIENAADTNSFGSIANKTINEKY